jgi:hypothetical protein
VIDFESNMSKPANNFLTGAVNPWDQESKKRKAETEDAPDLLVGGTAVDVDNDDWSDGDDDPHQQ